MRDETAGLLLALVGFASLSLGDAVIKTMAGQWPPSAVAALRYGLGAAGLVLLLLWREGPQPLRRVPRPAMQVLRGVSAGTATICFFAAIYLMPLAEAAAITFTSPIITAVLAAVFLREPAGKATWVAMLAAFSGVLIVLRPNFALLGWTAVLPLITALGMSLLFVCNRAVAGQASALAMQAYVAVTGTALLIAAAVAGHLSGLAPLHVGWPEASVVVRCAMVAVTATAGHWLIYLGTVRAGAARVAPMTYGQLLIAGLLGWLWFGDLPDATALAGAAIIVVSGIGLWRAESRRGRKAAGLSGEP